MLQTYLKVDAYLQFCVTTFACILACIDSSWKQVLYAIPVAHVLSFLVRLNLPFPKTRFFKIYGGYLAVFLCTYLLESANWFILCGILSVFFGIGFIVNCFVDFNRYAQNNSAGEE